MSLFSIALSLDVHIWIEIGRLNVSFIQGKLVMALIEFKTYPKGVGMSSRILEIVNYDRMCMQ